jgi:hypothetical protein
MELDNWLDRAKGTVFEGQQWICDYAVADETMQDKIFYQTFGERFVWNSYGIAQHGDATWGEKYGLLSLFRGSSHLMYVPIHVEDFKPSSLEAYRYLVEKDLQEGRIYARLKYLDEGFVRCDVCLEEGDNGDEDGFGVEPDTWMSGILNSQGMVVKKYEIYR